MLPLAGETERALDVVRHVLRERRLDPIALRYVGGFGRMSWVTAEDYLGAEPDPLTADAVGVLAHMNGDHAAAVLAYAQGLARLPEATAATMTAVDRYGFELAATPGSLAHDEIVNEDDTSMTKNGVTLLIDSMSYQYLVGAEIDYKDDLEGAQFVIKNPNATSTCGCGSSFSA